MNISSRKSLRAESTPASATNIVWKDSKPATSTDAIKTPPKLLKPVAFEISPAVPSGVRPRKRQSMTKNDVENSIEAAKRSRKDLSYSKPGPPTPARRHNRSNNSSLNSSAKSVASMNISTITTGSNVSGITFFGFLAAGLNPVSS